jgi:ethanolamine utilization microcompartment shell protein EutL
LIEQAHVVRDREQEEDEVFVLRLQKHIRTVNPLCTALDEEGFLAAADEVLHMAVVVVMGDAALAGVGQPTRRSILRRLPFT